MDRRRQETPDSLTQGSPAGCGPSKKNSGLLDRLQTFLSRALGSISPEHRERGVGHALGMLLNLGRHTLTGCLTTQGREALDWSADYRAYSAGRLDPSLLFDSALNESVAAQPAKSRIWVGMDDSTLPKTGRRIGKTAWRRDPLSPPFSVNFQWGHRVLQSSLLWPEKSGGARGLPVAFSILPNRPSKKERATLEAKARREAERQANVNENAVHQLSHLAEKIMRPMVAAVDGRFANKTFLRQLPKNCSAVARIRKDAVLFHPPESIGGNGRPRFYGMQAPRPEELRQDESHPWIRVRVYAAGKYHEMKIKTLSPLRSKMSGDIDGRLIVIAPLGYRLRTASRLLYREPAYLWVSEIHLEIEEALQGYVRRWEVEVNFRDEKTLLGVGQAQVRHPNSIERVPAWQVATYSALLWAAQTHTGQPEEPAQLPKPKWRGKRPPARASTPSLINQLRYDAWASAIKPEAFNHFWSASPLDQKPLKLPLSLPSCIFNAMA
jgi:hypothetical protein